MRNFALLQLLYAGLSFSSLCLQTGKTCITVTSSMRMETPCRFFRKKLKENASFTKVSYQDPHILPKLFGRQFPYGTGGYLGAMETIDDFKHFMLHAIHSLDGEFLDDKDGGEFLFFTYELSLKRKLYRDYVGRAKRAERCNYEPTTKQELYSVQRYSDRLAEIVPNSREALSKWKMVVQRLFLPGNRAPPPLR